MEKPNYRATLPKLVVSVGHEACPGTSPQGCRVLQKSSGAARQGCTLRRQPDARHGELFR